MEPRFNVFNQIHKGLRALMFDTATRMQQTDFGVKENTGSILEQTELLLSMFDQHAFHEDTCILEDAVKHNPEMIRQFEKEHELDLQLSSDLRKMIQAYKSASSYEERYQAGFSLLYALIDFVAFNLKHMNKEEQELNAVLWEHYSDEQLLMMEYKIQSLIPQEKLFTYFKWMIRGISNIEMIQWLIAVKNGAPEFVFNGLLEECRSGLPSERWNAIEAHLADGKQA